MKAVLSFGVVLLAAVAVAAAPPVPTDSPEHRHAQELVVQLGNKKYREREKAAGELVRMGRQALNALREGMTNSDPEVYVRCDQLIPQAKSLDLLHRIDEFLKDEAGTKEHDLPMWKTYRKDVGKGPAERKVFAEMLKANGALLEAAEEQPGTVTEKITSRLNEMYQEIFGNPFNGRGGYRPTALNADDLTCIMFAATQPAYKPTQPDYMMANLYTQEPFMRRLKDEKLGAPYRTVFLNFFEARMDDNIVQQAAYLFPQYQIKQGADLMAKAVKNPRLQIWSKASAVGCLGAIGTKDHIAALAPLLKDDSTIQQAFAGGPAGEIKMKDITLAVTIHLSGKNPKDFGFTYWQVQPNQMIQYHQLGFATAEARAEAFKKWDEASKKKDAEPKKDPAPNKEAEPKKDPAPINLPVPTPPKP